MAREIPWVGYSCATRVECGTDLSHHTTSIEPRSSGLHAWVGPSRKVFGFEKGRTLGP